MPRHRKILTFEMLHLCPMPMTKTLHYRELVEIIMIKFPVLTNNMYYPRIRKKVMFCKTSEQYLVSNVIPCLSDGNTLVNFKHWVFVCLLARWR